MTATRLPARVAVILFLSERSITEEERAVTPATLSRGMERGQVLFEEALLADEALWQEDDGTNHAGWWCVRTDPFPCPASGCDFIAEFMTAAHLILVWQEQDDPNLLKQAGRARDVGRNPRVVGYRSEFGPSASYYAWLAAGRPVHGVRAQ